MKKISKLMVTTSILALALSGNPAFAAHQDSTHHSANQSDEIRVTQEQINSILESDDAKKLFYGLDNYQNLYTVDKAGYHFKVDAEKNIPADVYKLMNDTFDTANQVIKERSEEKVQSLKTNSIKPKIADPGPGYTTVKGNSGDSYYYIGNDFKIGYWLYLNDKDTRALVNKLSINAAISATVGYILALFPPNPITPIIDATNQVAAVLYTLTASAISNLNKGYGIYCRASTSESYVKSRTY